MQWIELQVTFNISFIIIDIDTVDKKYKCMYRLGDRKLDITNNNIDIKTLFGIITNDDAKHLAYLFICSCFLRNTK